MFGGTASQYMRSWVARPLLPISQQKLLQKSDMNFLYLSMRNFGLHEYFVSFTLYSSCAKSHTVGTAEPRFYPYGTGALAFLRAISQHLFTQRLPLRIHHKV